MSAYQPALLLLPECSLHRMGPHELLWDALSKQFIGRCWSGSFACSLSFLFVSPFVGATQVQLAWQGAELCSAWAAGKASCRLCTCTATSCMFQRAGNLRGMTLSAGCQLASENSWAWASSAPSRSALLCAAAWAPCESPCAPFPLPSLSSIRCPPSLAPRRTLISVLWDMNVWEPLPVCCSWVYTDALSWQIQAATLRRHVHAQVHRVQGAA